MDKDHSKVIDKAHQKQIRRSFQYFLVSALLAIPFFIQIIERIAGYSMQLPLILQFVLATIIQFGCGWPFYQASYEALKVKKESVDFLIVLSTTAAYVFSSVVYLWNLPQFIYFESSAVLLTLTWYGRWIESLTKLKNFVFMTEQSQTSFFSIYQLLDYICTMYACLIMLISFATWLGWGLKTNFYSEGLIHSMAVLIIACPCMIGLAIPLIFIVARQLDKQMSDMQNNLNGVNEADLFRLIRRKIWQNLFLAFIYNVLTIPLAVMGLLNPIIVAGTMAMSIISVIGNSLLMRYWKPTQNLIR